MGHKRVLSYLLSTAFAFIGRRLTFISVFRRDDKRRNYDVVSNRFRCAVIHADIVVARALRS